MKLQTAFYGALPQHLLSRCGGWMARRRWGPLTVLFIRWFARHYGVNMDEADEPRASAYACFDEFFTRALRKEVRHWSGGGDTVASPVDGVVSLAGEIRANTLVQAKQIDYPLEQLLGGDPDRYRGGHFATLYLRPRDYHRVHMPIGGQLTGIRHLHGRLWPVRPWAVDDVRSLFARNERIVMEFSGKHGPWAMVMVGALMVGGMETVVTGRIRGRRGEPTRWNLETASCTFAQGEEIGRFHFGSTVILVLGPGQANWDMAVLRTGRDVLLGQAIGHLEG